jgi:hypothetical protein
MALTKLMGQNFRVIIGTAPVLEATSCQCTIQGNLEDATTKDSPSGYNMDQMTSKQWSVQVYGVDATLANLRELITLFNSDAKTTVGWDKTSGLSNNLIDSADFSRSGAAILNDLSIQANNRQTIQVSCQYQGSGALA